MDYWAATMQDDAYIIAASGWVEGAHVRQLIPTKNKDGKTIWSEAHDFKVGKQRFKSDLIPAALLIARYFAAEQTALQAMESELAELDQQLGDLMEEHGSEGGLLEEVVERDGDKRKISARAVTAQLDEIGQDPDYAEERKALEGYAVLLEKEAGVKNRSKAEYRALEQKIAVQYGKLTEPEIKDLVVDDKWLAVLASEVQRELDRVSQDFTTRVRQLADRYARPLPELVKDLTDCGARVDGHLKRMGAVWVLVTYKNL